MDKKFRFKEDIRLIIEGACNFAAATIAMVVLKVGGVIDWSWWVVFLPLIAIAAFLAVDCMLLAERRRIRRQILVSIQNAQSRVSDSQKNF